MRSVWENVICSSLYYSILPSSWAVTLHSLLDLACSWKVVVSILTSVDFDLCLDLLCLFVIRLWFFLDVVPLAENSKETQVLYMSERYWSKHLLLDTIAQSTPAFLTSSRTMYLGKSADHPIPQNFAIRLYPFNRVYRLLYWSNRWAVADTTVRSWYPNLLIMLILRLAR
jgi:hypothetical protein